MKKNIFLTGGGDNECLLEFNNLFIKSLNEYNIENIYYIPFGKKKSLYLKEFQKTNGCFKRIGKINFTLINNVEELINIHEKTKHIALFMAGGNVMRFINTIRGKEYYGIYGKKTEENQVLWSNQNQKNIEKYIVDFVNNGGFYYGTSSGALLAGKSLNTHIMETANEDREEGLNILDGQSVAPHYEEWQLKFYSCQENELKSRIIKLKDNEGLYYNQEIYNPSKKIKEQFIKRQIEHLRLVQDLMILLEINKDRLPIYIEKNWELLNRGMDHDLDKFQEYPANDYAKIEEYYSNKKNNISNDYIDEKTLYESSKIHYATQRHHTEWHKINNEPYSNIDICEMCCDIFANSLRNKDETRGRDYCLNDLFPNNPLLKNHENNILKILELLDALYKGLVI